jgi:cytochrome c551/c552
MACAADTSLPVESAAGTSLSDPADDAAIQQRMHSDDCYACHALDKTIVGPSFRQIADRYADVEDADVLLFNSTKWGAADNWGPVPMPPNTNVSDDDLHLFVSWILDQ